MQSGLFEQIRNNITTTHMGVKMPFILIGMIFFPLFEADGQAEIVHPTRDNLYQDAPVRNEIRMDKVKSSESGESAQILSTFRDMQLMAEIGTDRDNEKEMFSRIDDVVTDNKQRIFILNGPKQEIQVFHRNGSFLTTVGRKGRGPGEFESAQSMAVFADSLLLVSNGFRIEKFDISGPDITFVETLRFAERYRDLCVSGNRLFAHNHVSYEEANAANENKLHTVQVFGLPEFTRLFSFGRPYLSDNPMAVNRLSVGEISCNNSSATVVFTHSRMPVLQGYDIQGGQLEWHSYLRGMHHVKITETIRGGRPSLTYRSPEGKIVETLRAPVVYSGNYQVFQVERVERGEDYFDVKASLISFLLDSRNGQVFRLPLNIERVIYLDKEIAIMSNQEMTRIKVYVFAGK